ncbi:hypothetical protein K432DRAFT_327907 [Lepidopterella palustris CBS 459.81]|uniref:RRM domain-containing protein n=1 Tax=Lepidopterella palustris CBS 459.81 TaxID=1314670 RepID=A0A8E2JFH2_9PEZI|nr:hypothetical protein K432DRAFT_327907 [Lepidopterella palustris CBS 459.81]
MAAENNKLNRSLDEIMKEQRRNSKGPRRGARRSTNGARPSTVVSPPVGGVKKVTKPIKGAGRSTIPTGPSGTGDSKIIVSNLPMDVDEAQIKEYFTKTIGPVKKVLLTYGPTGQSRGVATIIFSKPASAAEAAKALDGVKVDNRPMKIEVILSAKDAPPPAAAKSLSDRNAAKAQPKPATATKATAGKTTTRGRGRTARGRNAGRGKPKTAQELDAEMQDYFDTGAGSNADGDAMVTNGGAVQAVPSGGDTGMDDEILVSFEHPVALSEIWLT